MIFLPFAIGIPVFAVFVVLALFRVFITFFTHQVGAESVIVKIFTDFELEIWTASKATQR